jgi:hypothetical protein
MPFAERRIAVTGYVSLALVVTITLPLMGQRTQVSHFTTNGAFARGFFFQDSGGVFTNGYVEVSGGCFSGLPDLQTHLYYSVTRFDPLSGVVFDEFGEGCIPNTALSTDPNRKTMTLNIDTAQLDPAWFFKFRTGNIPGTIVSGTWQQTDVQQFFSSGVSRTRFKFPGLVLIFQQQGNSETNSADVNLNLVGVSAPGGSGSMSFNRNVRVDITRTLAP